MDTLQHAMTAMEVGALNMRKLVRVLPAFFNSCRSASTEGAFDEAF